MSQAHHTFLLGLLNKLFIRLLYFPISPKSPNEFKNPIFLRQILLFYPGVFRDRFLYILSVDEQILRRICEGEGIEKRIPLDQAE